MEFDERKNTIERSSNITGEEGALSPQSGKSLLAIAFGLVSLGSIGLAALKGTHEDSQASEGDQGKTAALNAGGDVRADAARAELSSDFELVLPATTSEKRVSTSPPLISEYDFSKFHQLIDEQISIESDRTKSLEQRVEERSKLRQANATVIGQAKAQDGIGDEIWNHLEKPFVLPPDVVNWLFEIAIETDLAPLISELEQKNSEVTPELAAQTIYQSEEFSRLEGAFFSYMADPSVWDTEEGNSGIGLLYNSIEQLRLLVPFVSNEGVFPFGSNPRLDPIGEIHFTFLSHATFKDLNPKNAKEYYDHPDQAKRASYAMRALDLDPQYALALAARCYGNLPDSHFTLENSYSCEFMLRGAAIRLFGELGAEGVFNEVRGDVIAPVESLLALSERGQIFYPLVAEYTTGQPLRDLLAYKVGGNVSQDEAEPLVRRKISACHALLGARKATPKEFLSMIEDGEYDDTQWESEVVSIQEWGAIAALQGLKAFWEADGPDPLWPSEAARIAIDCADGSYSDMKLSPRVILAALEVCKSIPPSVFREVGFEDASQFYLSLLTSSSDPFLEVAVANAWASAPVPESAHNRQEYVDQTREILTKIGDSDAAWLLIERLWQVELAPSDAPSDELEERLYLTYLDELESRGDESRIRALINKASELELLLRDHGLSEAIYKAGIKPQHNPITCAITGSNFLPDLKYAEPINGDTGPIIFTIPQSLDRVRTLNYQIHHPLKAPFKTEWE